MTREKPRRNVYLDRIFRALADPTRLRLLNLMAEGEICVCYLVEVLGGPQPKISRHLAYLRRAGLVGARREGKWIHYRLLTPDDANVAAILRATLQALRSDREVQRDFERLNHCCCGPQSLVQLQGAPLPAFVKVMGS